MKNKSSAVAGYEAHAARVTRARAAAMRESVRVLPLNPLPPKPEKKRTQRENAKEAALEESSQAAPANAAMQRKRRAVLKDVTNICCDNSVKDCINAAKAQKKVSQLVKSGPFKPKLCSGKDLAVVPAVSVGSAVVQDDVKNNIADGIGLTAMSISKGATVLEKLDDGHLFPQVSVDSVRDGESTCDLALVVDHGYKAAKDELEAGEGLTCLDYLDIDSDHANPQMCCLYAPDIYANLRAAELVRRPSFNFMETLQRDITQGMRAILIDWLVEVTEEYRLVPDTLYLTVCIIDQFLSGNYIERPKLQLLGITCMLIASKYEEICAPRVEEFCFITDGTYSKGEVLEMESQVLNYLGFQLAVPTVKTFLRRFLRAAQASAKAPALVLGYLANYLAELTLIEYEFLKFVPSVVAASSVFLARWTLDQSDHPWNGTLEHYTLYKAQDLKATVCAMQDLQMNLKSCPLKAIREKYNQQKFESVAALTSPQLIESLFV